MLHPVLGMAYDNVTEGGRHEPPEIFEVVGQDKGLVFTNDVLPCKVRDIWTVGVGTYVGIGMRRPV